MKINDETMYFNGESTLVSLKNGGGKSVLIQMMMAVFVHKKYRDAKDRPFESYFTSPKPSFILIEWNLDRGAGNLLTGLMVRRNQSDHDENNDPLELISMISFYKEPCICDINHLPVVEKSKKEMVLKNFGACKQLFDSYKKDNSLTFFYYDMNMQAQSKQYFSKLKEYNIDYKEWEKIIKKVNLKESGLSDLFSDCKDEKGLVEKWFLETVEEKLSSENNRMNEFQNIIDKHVRQYSENESKIKRRDIIQLFKDYVIYDGETKSVLTLAGEFAHKENEETQKENEIANYLRILNTLSDETLDEIAKKEDLLEDIVSEFLHLHYEKYSCDINDLLHEKEKHERLFSQSLLEKNVIEAKMADLDEKIHILECAKVNETKQYEYREYEKLREKKKALDQSEEEKEPRRNELGSVLYRHYSKVCDEYSENIEKNLEKISEINQKIAELKSEMNELEAEHRRLEKDLGAIGEKIRHYDGREKEFNDKYGQELSRNVLGRYEEGFFEILIEESEGNLKKVEDNLRSSHRLLEEKKNDKNRINSDLEKAKIDKVHKENESDNLKKELEELEKEKSERKVILTYLELNEQDLYDRDRIVLTANRKVSEKDELIRQLGMKERQLEKEFNALTKGEILDLPEEFTKELENLEIHVVFGMEWLKKNGRNDKENMEIVRNNPFLPYALIMSQNDIRKLNHQSTGIYTSFPIPIVAREEIESGKMNSDTRIYSFEKVRFYVYFNENFLDEEKLQRLVVKKQEELQEISEKIKRRTEERNSYIDKKNIILHQKFSKELYEDVQNRIEELQSEIKKTQDLIGKLQSEKSKNSEEIVKLEGQIKEDEKKIHGWKDLIGSIRVLLEDYQNYLLDIDKKSDCEKDIARVEYQKSLKSKQSESMYHHLQTLEIDNSNKKSKLKNSKDTLHRYQSFANVDLNVPSDLQCTNQDGGSKEYEYITKIEAEYEAITSKISLEKKELEERMSDQANRFEKAQDELLRLIKKYRIDKERFVSIVYSEEEAELLAKVRSDNETQYKMKDKECNEENTAIQVADARMSQIRQNMKRDTGYEEPLHEKELVRKNFDAEINQLKYKEKEVKKQKDGLEKKLSSFRGKIVGLAEYGDLVPNEFIDFNKDFRNMSESELLNFTGILIRDYKTIKDQKAECKESLERRLYQINQMEQFQDEYFKKPIEAMLRLTNLPGEVIRQIEITIRSYDELMKKIEVDISIIEREKEEIVAQLLEYVKEVHEHLGKIDSNSTIKMRENSESERTIKMLRIVLPQWQDNAGMYENRVKDFVDDITIKGVELYHNNENAFNYFGTKINTKNLYDVVVGISNVQVKLFKIEQYKEYPITWAQVAKNSGGEGFLSSFVILSSLLYYMRKDENDIFADNNEGKVLLMDNPFAATYSEHLLKPLMKVAKKNNTQLICLTGLGGDSIYGRFDNIYVLNLVSAGLKRGVQYLRTDHVRGSEKDVMVMSHVKVDETEQLTLF